MMKQEYNPRFTSIESLRLRAKKKIPRFAFEYLDGGCNEELNLYKNTAELRAIELVPTYIKETSAFSLSTELFGHTYSAPFGIAPVGLQGLVWPKSAELLAKASFEHNIPFILSTVTTCSIERAAELTEGRAWFQLYHPVDDHLKDSLVERASAAGMPVLVVLADVPVFGYRPKEIKNGLAMPPRMELRNVIQILKRPHWAIRTLIDGQPSFASLRQYMPKRMNIQHLGQFMNRTFDGKLNLNRVGYLRDKWKKKLVVKGIVNASDVDTCIRLGVDGIIVSNHGGRQLDAGPSSTSSFISLQKEFGNKITLMFDSGVRSGPDIARSLAIGAQFTFLGRTFMYGVAALGNHGPDHTISILKTQLLQVMRQLSCESPRDLPSFLEKNIYQTSHL